MAERRMFAKTIIDSDAFLDLPLTTQALYFHLSMRADDEGFINNPKRIMRMIGASEDELRLLIAKSFIIPFESGIVVIKHWRIHNYIQKDRFKPTPYTEERSQLVEGKNKEYQFVSDTESIQPVYDVDATCIQDVSTSDTNCIQPVYQMDTQVRLGKDSVDKNISCASDVGQMSGQMSRNNYGQMSGQASVQMSDESPDKTTLEIRDKSIEYRDNISCASDDSQETKNDVRKQHEQAAAEMFERLWSRYPRKKGKGSVSKSQKLKLYKLGEEELSRALDRFNAAMAGRDAQYIPYGSTWFNTGYVDYLDENYQADPRSFMNPEIDETMDDLDDLF